MPAATHLRPGDVVADRYRIDAVLGAGATGTVYAAHHTWTRQVVALKVLEADTVAGENALGRLFREARALSTLHHPNIVRVLDMGGDEHDGAFFIAQELLDGEDLARRLQRSPHPEAREVIQWLAPIASALAHAHREGILHRDVKPANIFLERGVDGQTIPRLIDFGISRPMLRDEQSTVQTEQGVPIGTPRYMAPEQVRGDGDLDGRVDVWALGAVLYECLSGRAPFEAPSPAMVYARILTERARGLRSAAPETSRALAALVDRALSPDRAQRHPTMAILHEALCDPAILDAGPSVRLAVRRAVLTATLALALTTALALTVGVTSPRPPTGAAPEAPAARPQPSLPPRGAVAATPPSPPVARAVEVTPPSAAPGSAPSPRRARGPRLRPRDAGLQPVEPAVGLQPVEP